MIFHETIFGPIHSRRLGTSLGVNLMPNDGKVCSFDCVYCEAGLNSQGAGRDGIPSRHTVHRALDARLRQLQEAGETLNSITFSGNGEPTLHPDFKAIVEDVIRLRDRYYPTAAVTVLSNATMAHKSDVAAALRLVDNNVLKLDSAVARTLRLVNRPVSHDINPEAIINNLKSFAGQCIVQTMLLRGSVDGEPIDNTTAEEVDALLEALAVIKPRLVQLYSIDRRPPLDTLQVVSRDDIEAIAARVRAAGHAVQ